MSQISAFLPSIRVLQIVGLCPFSIGKGFQPKARRKFQIYSVLLIVASIIALAASMLQKDLYVNGIQSSIVYTVDFFQLVGIRIEHLTIVVESFVQTENLMNIFTTISEADALLEKLDIEVTTSRVKSSFLFLMKISSFVVFQLAALALIIHRQEYQAIAYWASYFFPSFVGCLRYYQLISLMWFIRSRTEILNARLADLRLFSDKSFHHQTQSYKLYELDYQHLQRPKPLKTFQKLILFKQVYKKLYNVSMLTNYAFGLSSVVNIANDFVSITANAYFVFLSLQNSPFTVDDILKVIQSVCFCFPHIINIVTVSAASHYTTLSVS